MTREQWTKIALEIAPHLEEIRRIAKRNGIGLNLQAGYGDGTARGHHIPEGEETIFNIDIEPDGIVRLLEDNAQYYTKIN